MYLKIGVNKLKTNKVHFREINNIFNNLNEAVIVYNNDESIELFNNSTLDILKLSKDQLLNKTDYDTKWFFIDENFKKLNINHYPGMEVLNTKLAIKNKVIGITNNIINDEIDEDNIIWLQLNSIPLFDKDEKIKNIIVSFVDITKQQNALKLAYNKTYFNNLTNLPNILSLKKQKDELCKKTLILVQIDNFNKYRQYFGQDTMDEIVIFIAKKLSKYTLENCLYHIELDKFALIIDSQIDTKDIEKKMQILNKDELYFEKLELNLQLTAGISLASEDSLNKAQIALSSAKKSNTIFEIYSANNSMFKELNNELFWSLALRKIINNDDLVLAFQPIINNKTLEIYKYEVLMRVRYNNEIHFPNSFLNISKQFKLYKFLTTSLIKKSFSFFDNKDIRFSINLNT